MPQKETVGSNHVIYCVTDYKMVPVYFECVPCLKLLSCCMCFMTLAGCCLVHSFVFFVPYLLMYLFIYFCIFPVTVLLVELYMCLFCTSDSKGGLWSTWFYLYVYVVCSSFLFSYFCAWFVMCWFCFFFLFHFHSHLHSPVHCILSLTVCNNQSCVITIGPIAGRPRATKVRRCNWVPARSR